MRKQVPNPEQIIEALDLVAMGLTAEQAYKIGRLTGDLIGSAFALGRVAAAEDIDQMQPYLGDEGWNALADQAAEADYDRRVVLRRRKPEDNFTALTIESAYQHGYREASKVARGGTRPQPPCCEFHDANAEPCAPDDQGGYCCNDCPTLAAVGTAPHPPAVDRD